MANTPTGIFNGICTVTLVGKFVRDPELITFSETSRKAKFSVYFDYPPTKAALEEAKKTGESAKKERVFLSCEAWNKAADRIMKYGAKGKVVSASYEVHDNSYTYDKEGTTIKSYGILLKVESLNRLNIFDENHWSAPLPTEDVDASADAATPAADTDEEETVGELPF